MSKLMESKPIVADFPCIPGNGQPLKAKNSKSRAALVMLAGAIGLQFIALATIAVPKMIALNTGKTIVLRTQPMDPYDPFRGEYLRFTNSATSVSCDEDYKNGEKTFVLLKKGKHYWTPVKAFRTLPVCKADEVAIQGTVDYCWSGKASVSYGIEQYFVPEGKSSKIMAGGYPDIEVSVDASGHPAIKRLLRNGREI